MVFIRPNFFQTITKLISRHFGGSLKRTGRVSTKNRCSIKLFHCNGFFVLLEERLSLMKYITMFVACLFRALYQGTDKILCFAKSMVRKQKLLGRIDKLRTLVKGWGRGSSKNVWKPMSHRWTVGVRSKRTYFSLFFSHKKSSSISTPGGKFCQPI